MLPSKISFVDLETTGTSSSFDRVIEVGILRVENNQIVQTFNSLVNPGVYVSPFIENMTGINASDLESAPSFRDLKDQILEILDDTVFVAHNVRFDLSFLKSEFARLGFTYSTKHFCSVKLSRSLYPQHRHHNLDSIISRFKIKVKQRHRAFDDAEVIWKFYQQIQTKFKPEILESAISLGLKRPTIPSGIEKSTIDNLPHSPGVYIFYGKDGAPLYIGKSKDIKNRVLSHFSSDLSSPTEMKISQQIASLEAIPTSGELGALLKEAELVKQLQPLYNRRLRIKRQMVLVKKYEVEGFSCAKVESVDQIKTEDVADIIGVFKSKKQAKEFLLAQAKTYRLCHKLLELEKTSSACFAHQLGNCQGACVNKEPAKLYNLRFIVAFTGTSFKPWPFAGPITIREKRQSFVIDKWCLVNQGSQNYTFDLDVYKILTGYLRSKSGLKSVSTQPSPEQIDQFI